MGLFNNNKKDSKDYLTIYDVDLDNLKELIDYISKFVTKINVVIHLPTNSLIVEPHGFVPNPNGAIKVHSADVLKDYTGRRFKLDDNLISQLAWGRDTNLE